MSGSPSRRLGKRPGPKPRLDRDAIIDAAIATGDRPLSMERVAAELGMAPTSLYRYVEGLEDLALAAAERLFLRTPLPSADGGWQAFLIDEAELWWALLLDHPGLVAGREAALLPVFAARFEAVVRVLTDLGFAVGDATLVADTVLGVAESDATQARWSQDVHHPSGLSEDARDHLTAYSEDVAAEVHRVMVDPRDYMRTKLRLVLGGLAALAPATP